MATVNHQGTVISFARAAEGVDLYYNVLDLKVSTAVDNEEWTGYVKLDLPTQLRPLGLDLVTVDDPGQSVLPIADAPLKALSDEKYVHLFQQSTRGTLLLNRFMLKRVAPAGGGATVPVLEPVWEVRYQRSGKQDVPDGDRDSQSYTTPDGEPFIEPTLELPAVRELAEGRFEALILPNQTGTANRWQFFGVNARTGALDLYSFPMDEAGLPDLSFSELDDSGNVKPDVSTVLELGALPGTDTESEKGTESEKRTEAEKGGKAAAAATPLTLAGVPSGTFYALHERVRATAGDDLMLKRAARVMLAQPVTQPDGQLQYATLDFALGKDGVLAKLPEKTVVTPVSPANYALSFSDSAYLILPDSDSLKPTGGFKTEFWFYPDSEVSADQFVFRGDPSVPADQAAPYLQITRDLHVALGFGGGGAAIAARTANAVITPGQWVHVAAGYDPAAAHGNFSVLINGNTVPVTGADNNVRPHGSAITTVSGKANGVVGIIDGLRLWNGDALAADWEFDTVDYGKNPPTTPDSSPNHNDAAVHGAVLVPSSAPSTEQTQGNLVLDERGLPIYCGLLDFAEPGGSPYLTAGSDGLVHLYFAGRPQDGRDGLFSVAQYNAEVARSVFEAGWTSRTDDGTQTGTVQFTAARSGSFMNQAAITIRPTDNAGLCEIAIDDRLGRSELWKGVPRALDDLVAVLNGDSTHDLADPAFRAGSRTFYDNTGTYAMSRLTVRSHGSDAGLVVLSRRPAALQLASAAVTDVADNSCTLALGFSVAQWRDSAPIAQKWIGLPTLASQFLSVLSGTSPVYDYKPTDSADAAVHGLTAYDSAQSTHDVLVLARSGVRDLTLKVGQGSKPELCTVRVDLYHDGEHHFELANVPRDQAGFAAAVNAHAAGQSLLLVTDRLSASVRNREQAPLPLRDLRAWSALTVAFAEETLAFDAAVPAQGPVPAAIRQRSTVTADGVEKPLDGPSTLFRALAATEPSNGGVALVQDTASYTGGTANLVVAAIDGGWLRVSPHKALSFTGANAVLWDQAGPNADVLAIPGDLTVEGWCRPGLITADTARPRIASYSRVGSPDFPDEPIRWAMGLHPAPSLVFTDSTAVNCSYDLKGTDCTLQTTVCPQGAGGSGQVAQLVTIGVSKPYLTVSVGADQKAVAEYADGSAVRVVGRTVLKPNAWRQLTATLEAVEDGSKVRVRLYVDGLPEGEATGAKASFPNIPGAFNVGKTSGAFPMLANGAFMWTRALDADEVEVTAGSAPRPNDPGLVVALYFTEGQGPTVRNAAVEGYPFTSTVRNPAPTPWSQRGVYALPWATNRGYGLLAPNFPLLGGWHHVACAYHTAYAVQLGGADYADCGDDGSLDFSSSFSVEALFTADRVNAVQSLVSKPGNYELSLNYNNTVLLTVPTDSAEVGVLRLASDSTVKQGEPCYVAATVATGGTKPTPPAGQQPVKTTYYLTVNLYINGALAKSYSKTDFTDPVNISTSTQRLNLGRSSAGAAYFTGQLSDVRLWNKALTAEQTAATQRTHRVESTDGLVSWWRWSEGRGKYAYDESDLNNAVLTANDLWRLYAANSVLSLFADGDAVRDARVIDPEQVGGYGAEQFTVAAKRTDATTLANQFTGQLSEVRVWNREHTAEQIREDMYRELTGAETGLVGYWTFDAGSGASAEDATGHGNDGALAPAAKPPAWVTARAPISDEAKEVYNILGGLLTGYAERITGIPSATEYPDTRRDAYGALYSVMKRCYAAQVRGAADLVTGFTVGDLDTVYAGQTQTAPSLVGFIEGAPPIPSENQTNPWWTDVNYLNSYAENTTVRLTQAQSTTRVFTGSQDTADTSSKDFAVGFYMSTDVSTSIGFIEETDFEVANAEVHLGWGYAQDAETGAGQELAFGYGKTVTTVDELSAAGEWERPDQVVNPEVGRRYIPENNGSAVVKSLTADMYLVKLKGSNTVVKMTLVPDPDIPEDVNLIPFPIDPQYTKNGTLDGMVGFTPDPSFPYAYLQPSSYFRPLEAYELKRQMERQDQQLEAYYKQFDTANLSRGANDASRNDPGGSDTGFNSFKNTTRPGDPSYDWQKGLAKRGIANTYVWTAAGGLHTEQAELVDTYSESFSGRTSYSYADGLKADVAAAMIFGIFEELDMLGGGSIEILSIRDQDSETGFGLEAEFAPDRYLKRPVLDAGGQPVGYTEDDAPGKVNGYRFTSFFLPPSEHNFEVFNTRVIDKNWLANSADPNAAALRTATVQANGAWRVLHRATYVSRVPPQIQPATADTAAPPVVPPAGLEGNTVITRMVEGRVSRPNPSPAQIGAAVTAVLGTSPTDPGLLAGVLPWWPAFVADAFADPRSDAHGELSQLRVDLLDYMIRKYAAQQAQAGGAALAELLGHSAARPTTTPTTPTTPTTI